MIRFSIFGIPVEVQPWFWLTMAFIGGGLHASNSTEILLVVVFALAGFLSILIHELGHATAIRRYQLPTSITLWAFGGYATFPPNRLTRLQSFLVTIAGPGVQLLAGILALFLGRLLPIPEGSLFGPFLGNFVLVSVVWAVLNCLPVYPMDGGQMLSAVLGPSRQRLVYLLSAVTALMVGLAGYAYLGTILLPIFMALFAWQNWQSYRQTA